MRAVTRGCLLPAPALEPLRDQLPHDDFAPLAAGAAASGGLVALVEPVATLTRREEAEHLVTRIAAAAFESLLHAIDVNDPETGTHVRRVAIAAVILARAADQTEKRQHRVERVALFHDIGKINGALFDVMRGTTGLTVAERKLIATHADRGAEVVKPLASFYPELPEGVRAHHEWWNGHGYPRGLRGISIPFEARIVTIADVFDALTHQRPYKRALSVARAARFIAAGRGTQFDPDLTDLFLCPPVQSEIATALRVQCTRVGASPPGSARSEPRRQAGPRRDTPEIAFGWHAAKGD
jgi:HD-GYP domain-containing protein (c-di-GMP phosphodiesterase class II)